VKTQTIEGEDAEMMILEGVNDADDETLAGMLRAMFKVPVKVVSDNTFEIEWEPEPTGPGIRDWDAD
jgi:hypothetical protein